MTNARSKLGYIIGSIVAGAGVFVSWFFESGLINTVASVSLGIVITLWTQNTIWKREDSIKRVEQVYSPLYGVIKDFIADKERREYLRRGFILWNEMKRDGRHLMVDENFGEKLDNFSERVESFDMACYKLNNEVIPKILKSMVEEVFHNETSDMPRLNIHYKVNGKLNSHSLLTVLELKKLESLSNILKSELKYLDGSKISDVYFSISNVIFMPLTVTTAIQQKISDYWELCLKKMKKNETFKFVINENENLLNEARAIEKELTKRIKETWKK
jgi:hypothetical protein